MDTVAVPDAHMKASSLIITLVDAKIAKAQTNMLETGARLTNIDASMEWALNLLNRRFTFLKSNHSASTLSPVLVLVPPIPLQVPASSEPSLNHTSNSPSLPLLRLASITALPSPPITP